jgi:hypothetical protein
MQQSTSIRAKYSDILTPLDKHYDSETETSIQFLIPAGETIDMDDWGRLNNPFLCKTVLYDSEEEGVNVSNISDINNDPRSKTLILFLSKDHSS